MIDAVSGTLGKAALTQGLAPQKPAATPAVEFASHLAEAMRMGEQAAIAGVTGQMPMQDVVQTVLAAERTLNVAVSSRDKVVSAYLELSRMQI